MGSYLQQAASPRVLNHAWRILHNDSGLWTRHLPMEVMQRNLIEHIGKLGQQLIDGHYRPSQMNCYYIDKGNGEKRLICATQVRDKLAQRAVLTVLEPLGERLFLNTSFGYRPGRTIEMALSHIRQHINEGRVWLVDADIKSCFDSIHHRLVLDRLKRLTGDKPLVRLVHAWINSQPPAFRPGIGVGLPQGMVLSPFLCNLVLHDLDRFLADRHIPSVRFADDFVLLASDEQQAQRMLEQVKKGLRKLKLELHPDKTRVMRSSNRSRFLGRRLPDGRPRFTP